MIGSTSLAKILAMLVFAVMATTPGMAVAQAEDHPSDQPLRLAADVGFAPFVMARPAGGFEGFSVDIAEQLAERLGRPGYEIIDVTWSAIFAGLFSKRYEMIISPTGITTDRAAQMLFTEPYYEDGIGFLTPREARITAPEELAGKRIGVAKGSSPEEWADAEMASLGFELERYDAAVDAIQAMLAGRIDGVVTTVTNAGWVQNRQPTTVMDLRFYIGRTVGYAVRNESVEFRNQIEEAIECMKMDGTLAGIYETWFGEAPGDTTVTRAVFVGYGAPGWPGYDPSPRAINCPDE